MKVKHIAHNVLAVVLAVSLVAGSVSIENIFADEFNVETNTPVDGDQDNENNDIVDNVTPTDPTTPVNDTQGDETPEPTPVEPTTPVDNTQGDETPEPTPVEPTTPVDNTQGGETPEPTPVDNTVTEKFTVTFLGYEDVELSVQEVADISEIEIPEVPEVEGYTFISWDCEVSELELTGDTTIKALYEESDDTTEKFTVTFLGFEDVEISVQEVTDLSEIVIPEAPEVEGYVFSDWDCKVEELELVEDTTIKAVYEQLFTVTFLGFEDVELSVQEVTNVSEIEIPEIPAVKGKQFDKWSVDLTELAELEEDLTIKAEYVDYELVEKTLTKELFDREFIVSGNMPEGTELVVKKVTNTEEVGSNIEESCGGSVKARVIEAYDITLLVDEIEYQPSEFDEAVTVTIKKVNIEKKDTENIEVFHIDGDNNAEPVTADVSDEAVTFTASSFSVYVIADVTYDTDDGTLLDNEYATAYLYDDGTLLVTEFKQNGSSINNYPWYPYKNTVPTLEFADTVTFIGNEAFNGYKAFSGTLTIPDSVETIGNSAFKGCTGFTGSLVIPNSVKTIGDHAFEGTNSFTDNLVISDSVETIGAYAFSNCSGFKGTLTLGNSVQTIGDRAFYCDSKLTGNLVIPDSVITIGDYAFYGLKGFTGSPTIGNSVETIGAYAFASCTGFTGNLVISNSVKTIGEYAFNNCTGLTGTLTLGNSLKTIGKQAFSGDLFTGALIIPNSVETIGESAFYMNNKFNALTLGNSVKSIDNFAFFLCAGFKGNLVIPNSVETIGNNVFFSCTGFDGTINLGTGVKTIGNAAFAGLKNVTGTLVIPASVESMGNYAFQNMNKINEVQINSQFTYGDKILYVKPEDKIDTTSNWDEIMSTTAGTDDWETLATSWNRFTPATYTVTFNADGGTPVPAEQSIAEGQTATEPTAPTKTGYTFKGWFNGSTEFDFNTPITGAITLKAKWEQLPDLSGYLTLDANGGRFSDNTTSKDISSSLVSKEGSTKIYESLYDLSTEIPTRDGYYFAGWFLSNFDDDSRDLVYNYKLINNSADDYIVYEKSTTSRIYVNTTVAEKTIKAGWIKKQYTLFDAGEGTFSNGEHTTKLETEYEAFTNESHNIEQYSKGLPNEDPTLEGYTFLGWLMVPAGSLDPFIENYPLGPGYHNMRATVNSDGRLDSPEDARGITLYLSTTGSICGINDTENGIMFRCQAMWGGVQYDAYGGTFADGSTTKKVGVNSTPHYDTTDPSYPNIGEYFYIDELISETPTRNGYTFKGWAAASGDGVTYSIYQNYEYPDYIQEWGSKYQLTHLVFKDTDGKLKIRNDGFNIYTGVVTKRDDLVQEFILDSNVYSSAYCSTLFLKAIWEPVTYTVTFNADGGTPQPVSQTVVSGQKATVPTAPTKTGYTFKGWFKDSTEFDFNTPITGNITLVAKWEQNRVEEPTSTPKQPTPTPDEPTPSPEEETPEEPTPTPVVEPTPTPTPSVVPTPTPDRPERNEDPTPSSEPEDDPQPYVLRDEPDDPVEPIIREETPIIVEPFIEEVIPEDELFIGNNTDNSETSKTAMQKFTEAVKKVAVVFSISLLAVLALLGLPLLLLLWLKRVKVQNEQNVDEYSEEENWKTVYKTKVKTEGNAVAELKKDSDRVWKLSIPESIITERTTDYFQVVLKKRFCKRYNGEEIVVVLESENDANVKNLVFVIDEKDNIIKFTVE